MIHGSVRRLAAFLVCLTQTACFAYRPATPAEAKPNEEIRVVLTDAAVSRLNSQFAIRSPLEGAFTRLGSDTIGVAVWVGRAFAGTDFATARQTVPLLPADIVQMQRKVFSLRRTVLFSLGVAALGVLVIDKVGIIDLPWEEREETPLPPDGSLRRPGIRWLDPRRPDPQAP